MEQVDLKNLDYVTRRGREDYMWFARNVLDLTTSNVWSAMQMMSDSLRDHKKTCVYAGHGVSKTYTLARLALAFLYCHPKSTVVTTAPTNKQVEDLLWKEIRESHAQAKMNLGGKMTLTKLDLQDETGFKWFATGFATRADTVTQEATAFQGYHNDNLLILFDEAAGILPEIWTAAQHIGAPYKRWLCVGNPTTAAGNFASCNDDKSWHKLNISVTDTPNYKAGKTIIKGLYGKEYVDEILEKYGEDSDEFRVRVKGQISKKSTPGAYYDAILTWMRSQGYIGDVKYNPSYPLYTAFDVGYTTGIWFFQVMPTGTVHLLRYYEDTEDIPFYADLLRQYEGLYGYKYAKNYAPYDVDNNQYKMVYGDGLYNLAMQCGLRFEKLPVEGAKMIGIERTRRMLRSCRIDEENCQVGLKKLRLYHQKVNRAMSTEDNIVYSGVPEKDGNDHCADALRYVSMSVDMLMKSSGSINTDTIRELRKKYSRVG